MAKKRVNHLPQEVITEILLQLPVKTLLRCKCVCKSWLSMISDPHFATSHFHKFAASPRLLFFDYDAPDALTIDFHAYLHDDSASSLSPDFLHPQSVPEIGGSCRGFLFLRCYRDFYIWNPSTSVRKQIPVSNSNKYSVKLLYGFGYDLLTDDYIVVVESYKCGYRKMSSIDLEIFSLRANEWKQIELDSDLPYRNPANSEGGPKVGSFLNGSIHWLVYNYETEMNVIIAFDLKEMTMSEIALPDDCYSDYSLKIYDVLLFQGLISVWNVEMSTLKMWVMQARIRSTFVLD